MTNSTSLVAQLRRRIQDERVVRTAFRFACVDEAASECLIQVSSTGLLTTTVLNGRSATNLSVDLTSPLYDTTRKLVEYLAQQPGYKLAVEQDFEPEHVSLDLQIIGSISCLGNAVSFKHHLFSDEDLLEVLVKACARHNVSYTPMNLPDNEQGFVLMLATADVARLLATDASKRRNLETTAEQFMQLARESEAAYAQDVDRQQRAIPTPKFDEEATEQGDVVIGTFTRRSLRTGNISPGGEALYPNPPVLLDFDPRDVEDTQITVRWRRNRDQYFFKWELWRDTVSNIERGKGSARLVYDTINGVVANTEYTGTQPVVAYTDTGSTSSSATAAPPIEPSTVYYYRLYIINLNGEFLGSNVISATTRAIRAKAVTTNPISPTFGPAGTTVTLTGTNFVTGMTVTIGGKSVGTVTVVNPTTATFAVPTFYNLSASGTYYDLVITSPNGLIDVINKVYRYV